MFMGDKKNIVGAIVARMKPEKAAEEKKEFESVKDELIMCAEEILSAIEQKDAKGLAMALAAFDEIHDNMEEEHEETEESEEKSMGEKITG